MSQWVWDSMEPDLREYLEKKLQKTPKLESSEDDVELVGDLVKIIKGGK